MRHRINISAAIFAIFVLVIVRLPAQAPQHFSGTADLQTMVNYVVLDKATPGIVLATVEADGAADPAGDDLGDDAEL